MKRRRHTSRAKSGKRASGKPSRIASGTKKLPKGLSTARRLRRAIHKPRRIAKRKKGAAKQPSKRSRLNGPPRIRRKPGRAAKTLAKPRKVSSIVSKARRVTANNVKSVHRGVQQKRGKASRTVRTLARGFTRQTHPKRARAEPNARERTTTARTKQFRRIGDRRFQYALKSLRTGKSARDAAKSIGVSEQRLTRQLRLTKTARKKGKRWVVRGNLPREWKIYSRGRAIEIVVQNEKASKAIGSYLNHLQHYLETNDPTHLNRFRDKYVKDLEGKQHPFETDENTLHELIHMAEPYEQLYRIVIPQ
jgi:hypothetical protein